MPPPQLILLLGPLRPEVEQAEGLLNEPLGSMLHHSLGGGRNCSESTSQTASFMV
jgi:hypothetical protein